MYRSFVKRALDILLSALGTLLLSPLFLLISCAVKAEDGGPVFFTQKRIGIHKSTFNILKFRTMRTDTPHDMPTHLLSDPERWITRVGRFLRRTSLDELPQILQILSGKMSIVGPRPALWNQYDLIAERDKYGANDVTPGLTGWAQVNGRDALEIEEKARYDGEYAQKLSFGLDLKIFLMTVINVLRHSDVVEGGTGTLKGAGK
jgi:O-antigen biosynthesis protein WbqP